MKKTDANQPKIVKALRRVGATVHDASGLGKGAPDLIVGIRGVTYLIEIKNPETDGKLSENQKKWHAAWRGHVDVAWTVEDAFRVIGISV